MQNSPRLCRLLAQHWLCAARENESKAAQWGRFSLSNIELRFFATDASSSALVVSAEAAHVAARRHIGLVNIPDYMATPPVEEIQGEEELWMPRSRAQFSAPSFFNGSYILRCQTRPPLPQQSPSATTCMAAESCGLCAIWGSVVTHLRVPAVNA
jgi:hypothetical protein